MEQNIRDALTDDIVIKAGELYNVPRKDIKALGGFENFVYEFKKDDAMFILRLVHSSHRTFNQVEAEMEFIDYLSKNGASVSTVVHSIHDHIIEKIEDALGGFFSASVFTKAPGGHVKREDISPDFYETFGKEVAKLHVLTKTYQPVHKRYHWHEEDFVEIGERSIPQEDRYMLDKCLALMEKIKGYEISNEDYGLIHTDLHFGNMFYDNGVFTFFDWDDSAYKHFISDIAIIIFYQFYRMLPEPDKMEERIKHFLHDFMKGYLQVNKLDFVWFERLNDFFWLRIYILYFVIYGAGEAFVNSDWGKNYIKLFKPRIKQDIPFVNITKILDFETWNSFTQKN